MAQFENLEVNPCIDGKHLFIYEGQECIKIGEEQLIKILETYYPVKVSKQEILQQNGSR